MTRSSAVLAAVRDATVGTALGEAAAAPFASGSWLFSHNGLLAGWPASAAGLARVEPLLALEAMTDLAFLWALVVERLGSGTAPDIALAATIDAVEAAAGPAGSTSCSPTGARSSRRPPGTPCGTGARTTA